MVSVFSLDEYKKCYCNFSVLAWLWGDFRRQNEPFKDRLADAPKHKKFWKKKLWGVSKCILEHFQGGSIIDLLSLHEPGY